MSNIHTGDAGTEILVRVKENQVVKDLSGATSLKLIIQGPDNLWKEVTAALYSDGTDGVIKYLTTSTDFPVGKHGKWHIQPKVAIPGWSGHCDPISVDVKPNADDVAANARPQ